MGTSSMGRSSRAPALGEPLLPHQVYCCAFYDSWRFFVRCYLRESENEQTLLNMQWQQHYQQTRLFRPPLTPYQLCAQAVVGQEMRQIYFSESSDFRMRQLQQEEAQLEAEQEKEHQQERKRRLEVQQERLEAVARPKLLEKAVGKEARCSKETIPGHDASSFFLPAAAPDDPERLARAKRSFDRIMRGDDDDDEPEQAAKKQSSSTGTTRKAAPKAKIGKKVDTPRPVLPTAVASDATTGEGKESKGEKKAKKEKKDKKDKKEKKEKKAKKDNTDKTENKGEEGQ